MFFLGLSASIVLFITGAIFWARGLTYEGVGMIVGGVLILFAMRAIYRGRKKRRQREGIQAPQKKDGLDCEDLMDCSDVASDCGEGMDCIDLPDCNCGGCD